MQTSGASTANANTIAFDDASHNVVILRSILYGLPGTSADYLRLLADEIDSPEAFKGHLAPRLNTLPQVRIDFGDLDDDCAIAALEILSALPQPTHGRQREIWISNLPLELPHANAVANELQRKAMEFLWGRSARQSLTRLSIKISATCAAHGATRAANPLFIQTRSRRRPTACATLNQANLPDGCTDFLTLNAPRSIFHPPENMRFAHCAASAPPWRS